MILLFNSAGINETKSIKMRYFCRKTIKLNAMNIQDRKISLAEKLFKIRNESLIEQIETLVDNQMVVAYTTAGEPLTLKQYHDRLELAKKQVSEDKVTSHSDLKKKIKKW